MTHVDDQPDLSIEIDETDTVSLTVELPRALVERLNALGQRANGGIEGLLTNMLADRVPYLEWKFAQIEEALADADSGSPGIPHEKVVAWVESWGKPDELPFPE